MRPLAAWLALSVLSHTAFAEAPEAAFAEDYKRALDRGRTALFFAADALDRATARGFRRVNPLADARGEERFRPGDRLAFSNRGRTLLLVLIGQRGPKDGVRLIGTHIDSPHLRLLQRPFRTSSDALFLRARAQGGIKDFHWEGLPLQLQGVVHAVGGREVRVDLGAREGFSFFVGSLKAAEPSEGHARWPRIAPYKRTGDRLFEVLAASVPLLGSAAPKAMKQSLLAVLQQRYGLSEADFAASELSLVPSHRARDVGLDRALVGGFGQDDRLCSFVALRALLDLAQVPERTVAVYLTDREEIGSTGASGAKSDFLSLTLQHLLRGTGAPHHEEALRSAYAHSEALSGDVASGVDPLFPDVEELSNAARLGRGPAVRKYTGHRGKMQTSDANAEFLAKVVRIFEAAGVPWQVSTMGKVDEGGGGTISKFLAQTGAEVLDVGAPVLSMHSPMELSSKRDLWLLHRAFTAFLLAK
jgi:aspartyl aminopeptidase